MEQRKIRVAITHGDTNGVGYEVIFKAFADPTMLELCTPIVYGSPKVAAYHRKALNIEANFTIINKAADAIDNKLNMLTVFDEEIKVELGKPSEESGAAALKAIDRALDDYRQGLVDVLVTAPVDNNNMFRFSGQERYLEDHLDMSGQGLSMLISERLRVALLTSNLPIKEVTEHINQNLITEKATALHESLCRDFCITNPRIAVLALNPKTGEKGWAGTEEQEQIIPAIAALCEKGIQTFGPYAADDFFGNGLYESFDGVIAMHHDQGATPFRSLTFNDGVAYTAGLPLVCTAPDHTALYDIAGKGQADEQMLRHAIYAAIDIFRHRAVYDEAHVNPLKKLYKEKRDDSEKVRFTIPKKTEK